MRRVAPAILTLMGALGSAATAQTVTTTDSAANYAADTAPIPGLAQGAGWSGAWGGSPTTNTADSGSVIESSGSGSIDTSGLSFGLFSTAPGEAVDLTRDFRALNQNDSFSIRLHSGSVSAGHRAGVQLEAADGTPLSSVEIDLTDGTYLITDDTGPEDTGVPANGGEGYDGIEIDWIIRGDSTYFVAIHPLTNGILAPATYSATRDFPLVATTPSRVHLFNEQSGGRHHFNLPVVTDLPPSVVLFTPDLDYLVNAEARDQFFIHFSEPVTGLTVPRLAVGGSAAAGVSVTNQLALDAGSLTNYTSTLLGDFRTGTLTLSLPSGADIKDARNQPLVSGVTNAQGYSVNRDAIVDDAAQPVYDVAVGAPGSGTGLDGLAGGVNWPGPWHSNANTSGARVHDSTLNGAAPPSGGINSRGTTRAFALRADASLPAQVTRDLPVSVPEGGEVQFRWDPGTAGGAVIFGDGADESFALRSDSTLPGRIRVVGGTTADLAPLASNGYDVIAVRKAGRKFSIFLASLESPGVTYAAEDLDEEGTTGRVSRLVFESAATSSGAATDTFMNHFRSGPASRVAPQVESIVRQDPLSGAATPGTVTYRATFTCAMKPSEITAATFKAKGLSGDVEGVVGTPVQVTPITWDVPVTLSGSGGSVRLDVINPPAMHSASGNPYDSSVGYASGEFYVLNGGSPTGWETK